MTALHYAAKYGEYQACDVLINRGADVNYKNELDGRSAIHYACTSTGNCLAVEVLLTHGANINEPDQLNYIPLHIAMNEQYASVEYLESMMKKLEEEQLETRGRLKNALTSDE
jgi:ankyrin repeat protein